MKRIIFSAVCGALLILFGALKSVWTDSLYFAIVSLVVLAAFWIFELIKDYADTFYSDDEEEFNLYYANLVNYSQNEDALLQNKDFYREKFKKSQTKYKIIEILKLISLATIIALAVMVFFINILK
jgi:hypothetical protein